MWKSVIFKLILSLYIFLNYSRPILADVLISKSNSRTKRDDVSTKKNQLEIDRPGEKWIVVNEISCWESNGRWENATVCPDSTIVWGHRFRFLSRTGLTGIQLLCAEKHRVYGNKKILEMNLKDEAGINLPRGEWENWTERSLDVRRRFQELSPSFAVGFAFAPGEMNLRRSVKNFHMIYHSKNQWEMIEQSALHSSKVVTKCPEDHAICGLTAMMDKEKLGILTAIGLKCCFYCVAQEKLEIVYQHNNTTPCKVKVQFNATVSVQQSLQDFISESAKPGKTVDSAKLLLLRDQAEIFARIRKSTSTDFDWTRTADSIWTDKKTVTEDYTCAPRTACVFKQLVGRCEIARVRIHKFHQDSTPIENSSFSSESPIDPQSLFCCSDAMENSPSRRPTKQSKYSHGNSTSFQVVCDFEVDGGGWTVIQKRSSGLGWFNRIWDDYVKGFGFLDGNFWLGLENIHALTKNGDQELRIELEDFEGEKKWAKYSSFSISDASDFYRLNMSGFSPDSTAGDSMTNGDRNSILNGMRFTTMDKDNDLSKYNCADEGWGGWWYNWCSLSRLNGRYQAKGETGIGIIWASWKGYESLAKTEMKIRKRKSKSE